MRKFIRRPVLALIGFAVGWLVAFIEGSLCYTAYGGPFTVLMSFVMEFVFSGVAVGMALLVGLILLTPGVRDLWRRIGYWSLILSVASVGVIIFSSKLGLRNIDPVSNYRIMPFGIWSLCMFGIVFPIVNLPERCKGND
jgi:hypothetical protein